MKAKQLKKRTLSIILAAVMLLSMIPAWGIGASALTVSALTVSAEDPAGTEYVINSIDDWKAIAEASAAGNNFNEKTVKLGVDIDGTGIEDFPTLFPNNFMGTFDGNGKTISNVTLAAGQEKDALIASVVVGGTITDVILDNVKMTSSYGMVGLVVGQAHSYAFTLDGITVKNSSLTLNTSATSVLSGGGVIGDIAVDKADTPIQIKNISLSSLTLNSGLSKIGGVVGDVRDASGNLKIENVTMDGVSVTNTAGTALTYIYNGGLIGTFEAASGDLIIDNISGTASDNKADVINVTTFERGGTGGLLGGYAPVSENSLTVSNVNLQLDIDGTDTNWRFEQGVGGIIGDCIAYKASTVNLSNIILNGEINALKAASNTNAKVSTGGFIGVLTEYHYRHNKDNKTTQYAGTITVTNSEMNVNISSAVTANNIGTGGIIGTYGVTCNGLADANYPDMLSPNAKVVINNCAINGNIMGNTNSVGAIAGWGTGAGTTWDINNVIITSEMTAASGHVAGLLFGRALRSHYTVNAKNITTTIEDATYLANEFGTQKGSAYDGETGTWSLSGYNTKINGIEYVGNETNYARFALQNDTVLVVTEEQAAKMVNRTAEGYISSVDGHLYAGYEQHTPTYEKDGKTYYDARFITLAYTDNAASYSISIVAKKASGDIAFNNLTVEPYDTLIGYGDIGEIEYNAVEMGGKKFLAVVIKEIPTGEAIDFEVTASYATSANGIVISDTRTAHFDANGACESTPVAPKA